jgi:hypothetical protein
MDAEREYAMIAGAVLAPRLSSEWRWADGLDPRLDEEQPRQAFG